MIKRQFNINFMGIRRIALGLSIALVLGSLALLMTKGLNLGIDFSGGNLVQLEFASPVAVSDIRDALVEVEQGQSVIQ
ncbi:MAG: protein translocase subunit SecF, partial [Synergistota bacterium]|nr:protein translocase subunit SecF [Synergistota bacterium]